MPRPRFDVLVVGGGHNGLVAATLLAQAGRSVGLFERSPHVGGASVSEAPFAGVDVRVSRYAYLVSLFPPQLAAELGIALPLARRPVASCTPVADRSLLLGGGDDAAEITAFTADAGEAARYAGLQDRLATLAEVLFPTLIEPLRPAREFAAQLGDGLWQDVVERPLGEMLAAAISDDVIRGLVATDGLIGTLARLDDPGLAQNRCFLYHLIGGDWRVPIGGMGAITESLRQAALAAGVRIETGSPVTAVDADGKAAKVTLEGSEIREARELVWAAAPALLEELLGGQSPVVDDGCQLKVNMVLERLPRLKDESRDPRQAFAGTLHLHESATELDDAHDCAASGQMPEKLPSEVYCHTLTDRSILGPGLRDGTAQTLTLFALHAPAALFREDPGGARDRATAAALAALDDLLAEPISGCLMRDAEGRPCVEAKTPLDLEHELAMPGGNIFHRELQWPWAETDEEVGRWGVETVLPNVVLGGAGARRGGGVSGVPGHNAARALLDRPIPG